MTFKDGLDGELAVGLESVDELDGGLVVDFVPVAQIFAGNQVDKDEGLAEVNFVLTELVEGLVFPVGEFEELGRGEDEEGVDGVGQVVGHGDVGLREGLHREVESFARDGHPIAHSQVN